jgi:hypothetical protein
MRQVCGGNAGALGLLAEEMDGELYLGHLDAGGLLAWSWGGNGVDRIRMGRLWMWNLPSFNPTVLG